MSPLITTNDSVLQPNIVTTKLVTNGVIETIDTYLSAKIAILAIIIDPCQPEALMQFTTLVSLNGLSTKTGSLIDTTYSLNFVSKEVVMATDFYKDRKTTLNVAKRVASEQYFSTTKQFCPSAFTIDKHKFTYLQFRVLPHFKSTYNILGLQAFKQLDVVIHPSLNTFTMGNFTINCNRESSRISCMIVDSEKMYQIIVKQARNKKNPNDVFLISLHFAEDFGHPIRVILKSSLTTNSNNSSRSLRM